MKKKPTYEDLAKRVGELEREALERDGQNTALLEQAEILRLLLNTPSLSAILLDLDFNVIAANAIAAQRVGKEVDELVGMSPRDYLSADRAALRSARAEEVVRSAQPVVFQDERDGRHYENRLDPVFDAEGNIRAIAVCTRDITETQHAIDALLESEENFRFLAENANDGILIASGKGSHVYANRRASEITGYTVQELLQTEIRDLAHPDELPAILEKYAKRLKGEEFPRTYETRIVRKDGVTVPIELTGAKTTWKGEPSDLVLIRDVTERSRIETELRGSEERFRAIFEGALDAILLVEPETGNILDANPTASELLWKSQEEIVGLHYRELFPSRWMERVDRAYESLFEEERTITLETDLLRSDGREVPVEVLAQLIQIDGIPVIHALVRDITDRKRMDKELRDSEEQFRTLAEASLAGIFIYRDGLFRYANPALGRMFGYGVSEMVGRMGPIDLVRPEDREAANAYARKSLKGGAEEIPVFSFRGVKKDGRPIDCEVLQAGIQYRGRRAFIGTILDVTRRKLMEEELLKTQKLESLGVLAGGIAHDFNNILTAISTNISMARLYGDLEDDISQMMADAEKASVRAKALTQQLLAFARGGAPIRKNVPLAKVLRENTEFALSGSNVNYVSSIPKDLWQVEVDEGQIGQVLHNLVINAVQAMPEGGSIRVGARNVSPRDLAALPLKPGRYVKVFVSDQGIGIPERHLNNIFDPFFTTKQKGSGLGLTSSFTIVRNHEGHIHVDSKVDKGTTVDVYLPASEETSASEKGAEEALRPGKGRVLLIDDERMIRRAGREALARLGYDATLASDGAEGSRLYVEAMREGRGFDVVLLDLTIPGGMGGKDTVRDLLRIDPNAKVIASSGYSNDPLMADYKAYGFREVIVKPYRVEDLGEVLHRVLEG